MITALSGELGSASMTENSRIIEEWLVSDEGVKFVDGVYQDAFDEGYENAMAALAGLDVPDEIIPTMSDDEIWRMFRK